MSNRLEMSLKCLQNLLEGRSIGGAAARVAHHHLQISIDRKIAAHLQRVVFVAGDRLRQ